MPAARLRAPFPDATDRMRSLGTACRAPTTGAVPQQVIGAGINDGGLALRCLSSGLHIDCSPIDMPPVPPLAVPTEAGCWNSYRAVKARDGSTEKETGHGNHEAAGGDLGRFR